jgi:catechol-2,3-dioxygenase
LEWAKKKVELLWLEDYDGYTANFVNWNAQSFYFLDPSGNIVELIARFDLNDHATDPFRLSLSVI